MVDLDKLNEEQQDAVTTTEGYVRVIAGAGSGKTRALTMRYAYLVECIGVIPSSILCVTFTNKAAFEMKKRIRGMIGDMDFGFITTFHGFCNRFIKDEGHHVGYPKTFMIIDNEDRKEILKHVISDLGFGHPYNKLSSLIDEISARKHDQADKYIKALTSLDPQAFEKVLKKIPESDEMSWIFWKYVQEERRCFGLDFDDLVLVALYILKNHPSVRLGWQKRLEYVMVDEFQDVSRTQLTLAETLSGYHNNLFVVGDPDQTIYSFRGADPKYILSFTEKHPDTKTIVLSKNYRSSKEILGISNTLIKHNRFRFEKELLPIRDAMGRTVYFHGKSAEEEAAWIAAQVEALHAAGAAWSDSAVLYRASYLTRSVEEALVRRKIPYRIYQGVAFYGRKEIKDAICYLRLALYGDDLSFKRVVNEPRRGMGKKRLAALEKKASADGCTLFEAFGNLVGTPLFSNAEIAGFWDLMATMRKMVKTVMPGKLLDYALRISGYEAALQAAGDDERLDNLAELRQSVAGFESEAGEAVTLEDYLSSIALYTTGDDYDDKDAVKLMTIHGAKGLEFPFVFVCGMSEGILPSSRAVNRYDLEEERRIAYVAFTRAKNRLFLSDSEGFHHSVGMKCPSRFIFDCERVDLDYVVELPDDLVEETRRIVSMEEMYSEVTESVSAGCKINHPTLGFGVIKEVVDAKSGVFLVHFGKLDTERTLFIKTEWLIYNGD